MYRLLSSVPRASALARVATLTLFASFPIVASAQSTEITGVVKDPGQTLVANVSVTLINTQTQATFNATTTSSGRYDFPSIVPGIYRLEAHKDGFASVLLPAVNVTQQGTLTLDLAFAFASADSSVTVNARLSGTAANGYYVNSVNQGVMGSTRS